MRAGIVERIEHPADIGDGNPSAPHIDGDDSTGRYLIRLDNRHEIRRHDCPPHVGVNRNQRASSLRAVIGRQTWDSSVAVVGRINR
jgi:hypothetical protein